MRRYVKEFVSDNNFTTGGMYYSYESDSLYVLNFFIKQKGKDFGRFEKMECEYIFVTNDGEAYEALYEIDDVSDHVAYVTKLYMECGHPHYGQEMGSFDEELYKRALRWAKTKGRKVE